MTRRLLLAPSLVVLAAGIAMAAVVLTITSVGVQAQGELVVPYTYDDGTGGSVRCQFAGITLLAGVTRVDIGLGPSAVEIDGNKPFYVRHGWGGWPTECGSAWGWATMDLPALASFLLANLRFQLRIDGTPIVPDYIRVDPTDGTIVWYFEFPANHLVPGVHIFEGRWIRHVLDISGCAAGFDPTDTDVQGSFLAGVDNTKCCTVSADQSFRWERSLVGHSDWVRSVAFSPDGKMLASGSFDGVVKFWQVGTWHVLRTENAHDGSAESLAFSPDGRFLASGSDGTAKLWDSATGALIRVLIDYGQTIRNIRSIALSPDSALLASGSGDGMVRLWDTSTGGLVRTLAGNVGAVFSVAFSPDGTRLASGSADGAIRLWNSETGDLMCTLPGHLDIARCIMFSPDGTLLASGSYDKTIKLWNAETGAPVRTLTGHTEWIQSVAFSPDGTLLASGSGDGTVKLWEVPAGILVCTLRGHTSWVASVAFSPDGTLLASGSGDRTIKLWCLEDLLPVW